MKQPRWTKQAKTIAGIGILAVLGVSAAIWMTGEQVATENKPATVSAVQAEPPAPASAPSALYSLLKKDQGYSIAVREDNDFWSYQPGNAVFFYTSNPEISFAIEPTADVKDEEFETLRKGISVKTVSGKQISIDVSGETAGEQVVVSLSDVPQEDLVMSIASPDGRESKIVPITYTKKFSYTVHSPQNERVKTAFDLGPEIAIPVYLDLAREHSYHLGFSLPVDRISVENKLKEQLGASIAGLTWESDQGLELGIKPAPEQANQAVTVELRDVKSKQGYPLSTQQSIAFTPTALQQYEALDPSTKKKQGLFRTIEHYESLQLSPDGKWILAADRVENVHGSELMYTLVYQQGEIVKRFGFREMLMPNWLPDQSILYLQTDWVSGASQAMRYNPVTKQASLFWKPEPVQEKNKRILSIATEPVSGQIAIGYGENDSNGLFTYDIRWYRSMADTKPISHPKVGTFVCMEGNCLAGNHFFGEGKLVYTRLEEIEDIYKAKTEPYLLDLKSGKAQKWSQPKATEKQKVWMELLSGAGKPTLIYIVEQPTGNEKWHLYQTGPQHERTLETHLSYYRNDWVQFHPGGRDHYLFQVKDHGWMELNTRANRIKEAAYVPKEAVVLDGNHPTSLIWYVPVTK